VTELANGLFVLEFCRRSLVVTAATLGETPGWDRVKAHRYLTALVRLGWLEARKGRSTTYCFGDKAREFRW
jgi:DNA-binding IclR family transcriptional regulator